MPVIGQPDYLVNSSSNPTAPSFDAAEDTSRLLMGGGSLARSGRWMWASGFEGGMNDLYKYLSDAACSISISDEQVYQGKYSVKMVAGNTLNSQAMIGKYYHAQGARYGMEFTFSLAGTGGIYGPREIFFNLIGPNATPGKKGNGQIVLALTQFSPNTAAALYYYNGASQRVLIADVSAYVQEAPYHWHYVKFVFDTNLNQYVRLIFDDLNFDLSGIGGMLDTSPTKYMSNRIHLVTTSVISPVIYIDNMILTADEP
jgi:hypothetical protein